MQLTSTSGLMPLQLKVTPWVNCTILTDDQKFCAPIPLVWEPVQDLVVPAHEVLYLELNPVWSKEKHHIPQGSLQEWVLWLPIGDCATTLLLCVLGTVLDT